MRLSLPSLWVILSLVVMALSGTPVQAQNATGTLPGPRPTATGNKSRSTTGRESEKNSTRPVTPVCNEDGTIILQCGTANCSVMLNRQSIGPTDTNGELRFTAPTGTVRLTVGKTGYKSSWIDVRIRCGETKAITLKPSAHPLQIRVHTSPPNSEVRINQALQGRSSDEGLLVFNAPPERTLLVVSKPGYLSDTQILDLAPQSTPRDVNVVLMPIPAHLTVHLPDGIANPWLTVDNQATPYSLEPLSLAPGPHRITAGALGYASMTIEVTAAPGSTDSRAINLLRLSPADLQAQAEQSYRAMRYEEVYTLSKYLFEADPQSAPAHRLLGLYYLAKQDYSQAEQHLKIALDGNETFALKVRHHLAEEFNLQRPHTDCPALLIFYKNGLALKGLVQTADDFQVPYGQVRIKGLQLKSNKVIYLSTSVILTTGKRKDFNFYSYDDELSLQGKPYLELLLLLIKRKS